MHSGLILVYFEPLFTNYINLPWLNFLQMLLSPLGDMWNVAYAAHRRDHSKIALYIKKNKVQPNYEKLVYTGIQISLMCSNEFSGHHFFCMKKKKIQNYHVKITRIFCSHHNKYFFSHCSSDNLRDTLSAKILICVWWSVLFSRKYVNNFILFFWRVYDSHIRVMFSNFSKKKKKKRSWFCV